MTSGPITSWQIEGRKVETVTDFILLGSEITANDVCSHEIKKHLLLGRKGTTNLGSISKSRDVILPTKVCIVKVMVFPVVMYGCESWAIKKAASCVLSCFSCVRLCAMLWTVAHQAPLSMGFSRQEYWSGLPCPPLGELPNPEIEPTSHVSCISSRVLYH